MLDARVLPLQTMSSWSWNRFETLGSIEGESLSYSIQRHFYTVVCFQISTIKGQGFTNSFLWRSPDGVSRWSQVLMTESTEELDT